MTQDRRRSSRAARPPLPDRRHPRRGPRGRPALHPPGRGLRRHGVPAGPRARPRRAGARSASCAPRRRSAPTPRSSRSSPPARARSRSPPPWSSPACCATSCATPRWARSSPRSSRTRPGPSGSSRSSPRRRSTRPRASTTSRSTPTCRCTTPRAPRGRSSRRGSPRPARWPSFTAARHRLRHLGPAHGAGLPLLFHVRVPAGGRPGLGARRHAGPGHPGRLHGRAHHAPRRGAPARRRPVAAARLDQSGGHGLRRLVRLRGGRPSWRPPSPDARARPRGPLLVPHALQRELPDAGPPRGRGRGGHPPGHHRRRLPLRRRRPR